MNIIRECTNPDIMAYFDGDSFTENSGDFCNTLFILRHERFGGHYGYYGLNDKAFKDICDEIEQLLNDFDYASENRGYTFKQAIIENGLAFTPALRYRLLKWYKASPDGIDCVSKYLSIKTGKEWATMDIHGYCQGDYCIVLYCKERYERPEIEGEIWLGCCKEFSIQQDRDDMEVFGYYVADCQVRSDEDYKKVLCEYDGLDPENTQLVLIDGYHTQTVYDYKVL